MIKHSFIGLPLIPSYDLINPTIKSGEKYGEWLSLDYPPISKLHERLNDLAQRYAIEVLGTKALNQTGLHLTHYTEGMFDPEHVDQYHREQDNTMDRTVSCSLLIERANKGGLMTFQDKQRHLPKQEVDLVPGEAAFFPGDWWHSVFPVMKGRRRAIVCWWSNGTGIPWHSST